MIDLSAMEYSMLARDLDAIDRAARSDDSNGRPQYRGVGKRDRGVTRAT